MKNDFTITQIHSVIMVDKNEYPEAVTEFQKKKINNELIFHFSGKSRVYFNDKVMDISPETLRFLPGGEVTRYTVERIRNGECIDIIFDTDRPVSDAAFTINLKNNIKIASLFRKIFSVWVAKNDGYYFESISYLYKIFAELQKEDYIPDKQYLTIKPGVQYITDHFYKKEISVDEAAKISNVSYSYFKRLFLKKYRVTPKKYIIELRLNFACDLLRRDDISITRIAAQCGFTDIYFFSRQFKEYIGITPSEFRKKYKSSK